MKPNLSHDKGSLYQGQVAAVISKAAFPTHEKAVSEAAVRQ
jgi:hypothetical protein